MKMTHPYKKKICVKIVNGCPQVLRREALKVIEELEDEKQARRMSWRESKEKGWLLQLVEAHPVVKALPTTLKQGLVECLAEDLKKILGCNRRRRRSHPWVQS